MLQTTIGYKYIRYEWEIYLKVDSIPTKDIEDVLYAPDVDITEEWGLKQIKKARARISKIISWHKIKSE